MCLMKSGTQRKSLHSRLIRRGTYMLLKHSSLRAADISAELSLKAEEQITKKEKKARIITS